MPSLTLAQFFKFVFWFHSVRLFVWIGQLPLALLLFPGLQNSLAYLVFVSIAALIEGALTDVCQAWEKKLEARKAGKEPGE